MGKRDRPCPRCKGTRIEPGTNGFIPSFTAAPPIKLAGTKCRLCQGRGFVQR